MIKKIVEKVMKKTQGIQAGKKRRGLVYGPLFILFLSFLIPSKAVTVWTFPGIPFDGSTNPLAPPAQTGVGIPTVDQLINAGFVAGTTTSSPANLDRAGFIEWVTQKIPTGHTIKQDIWKKPPSGNPVPDDEWGTYIDTSGLTVMTHGTAYNPGSNDYEMFSIDPAGLSYSSGRNISNGITPGSLSPNPLKSIIDFSQDVGETYVEFNFAKPTYAFAWLENITSLVTSTAQNIYSINSISGVSFILSKNNKYPEIQGTGANEKKFGLFGLISDTSFINLTIKKNNIESGNFAGGLVLYTIPSGPPPASALKALGGVVVVPNGEQGCPVDAMGNVSVVPNGEQGCPVDAMGGVAVVPNGEQGSAVDAMGGVAVVPNTTQGCPVDGMGSVAVVPNGQQGSPVDAMGGIVVVPTGAQPAGLADCLATLGFTLDSAYLGSALMDIGQFLIDFELVGGSPIIQNNPDRTESYDAMDGDEANKIEAITGQKGQEVPEFEMHTVTALVDSSMWDSETDSIGPMALASRPSAQSRKARLLAQNFSSIGQKQDPAIDFYALVQNHEALTHKSGKIDLVVRPFGSTFHGMQTKGTISGCMLGMRYKEKNYSVQLLGSFESQKAKLPEDVARRKTNQVYGGIGASVGDIEDFGAVSYHFIGSVGTSRTARKTFALNPALSLAKGRSGIYTQSHVVSLARSLPFSSEVNFIPTVTFTLRKTKEKGYTENDAGAFAIAYQPQKMKFFRQELAFKWEMKSPGLSIQATPFVYAIQGPRELNRDASFVINPSPYTLSRMGKTKVFTGLTLTTKMALKRSLFFKIQAKGEFSSKAHMFTALLELQKVF